jgi:sugar/nucleoside kinase (ribokinase family)
MMKKAGVKLGPKGCIIRDGIDLLTLGGYPVPVADICGAGDTFIVGFLYGVLQEWEVETTAKLATAAASLRVQSAGATSVIPKAHNILKFIKINDLKECHICLL